jgi:hypothetical protein
VGVVAIAFATASGDPAAVGIGRLSGFRFFPFIRRRLFGVLMTATRSAAVPIRRLGFFGHG